MQRHLVQQPYARADFQLIDHPKCTVVIIYEDN